MPQAKKNHSTEQQPSPSPQKRKRLRVLATLFLLLIILLGVAQGPGLRWAAKHYGPQLLSKAGFTGNFTLEGSLLTGISLSNVRLASDGPARKISADRLDVHYRLSQIIHGNIDSLTGKNINIWIDLNQQRPKTKEKSTVELAKIRAIVLPIKIDLQNCAVKITQGNTHFWGFQNTHITHSPASKNYLLAFGTFTDMENHSERDITTKLTWEEKKITIKNFPARTDTRISELRCTLDNITPVHLFANIHWEDADFTINLSNLKTAQLKLTRGAINLDKIALLVQKLTPSSPPLDFGGNVTTLDVTVPNIMAPPSSMVADLHITGEKLRWQKRIIQKLQIDTTLQQGNVELYANLNTTQESPSILKFLATLDVKGLNSPNDWAICWHNAKANLSLKIPEPTKIIEWAGIEPPPGGWPTGALHLFAKGALHGENPDDSSIQLEWLSPQWAGLHSKEIHLTGKWEQALQKASFTLNGTHLADGVVTAYGEYFVNSQKYSGNFCIKDLNIKKLRPALLLFKVNSPRAGIVNLSWSGSGTGRDFLSYSGKINADIKGLDAEPIQKLENGIDIPAQPQPTSDITLNAHYEKNLNIQIDNLKLNRAQLQLHLQGAWKNNTVNIPLLELRDSNSVLIKGNISCPLSTKVTDLKSFRAQKGPLHIAVNINQLPLSKIFEQLPSNKKPPVTGNLTSILTLTGTLQQPVITLKTDANQIKVVGKEKVPSTDLTLNLFTKKGKIHLDGLVKPHGHQNISLSAQIPFNLDQWIDNPNSVMDEPIQAVIDTKKVDLSPYTKAIPQISKLDGFLSILIKAGGTLKQPKMTGRAQIKLKRANFKSPSIPDIKDLDINLTFADNQLTFGPSSCLAAGGKYQLSGSVDLKDFTKPIFNISLLADKALIIRNDMMIVRTDANLKLKGPFDKAQISGDIGITQSLFYKDIQIIPLGSRGSSSPTLPGKATLPSFTKPHKTKTSSIPQPFANWTLDVKVLTKDPFLVRGNLAEGNATANITVKGTVIDPKLSGKAVIQKLTATLPFSQLNIQQGKVIFSPETGLDPRLSIKATSRIGEHNVKITVYGRTSSPKHLISSNPPLPENEVIFLLATGSTSDQLTNADSATGKAFQLLIDSWVRSSPENFKTLKSLVGKLNKTVNINIGAIDQFTGRKYNSATIKIDRHWFIIASMDLENNTRGLFLYTIRFK